MGNFTMQYVPDKEEKPTIRLMSPELTASCDEPDGQMAMLARELSGCVTVSFTKLLDKSIKGIVSLDGRSVRYFHGVIPFGGGIPVLALYVAPYLDEYDHVYTLHLEAFADTDGNVMDPTDIPIHTAPKTIPSQENEIHENVALQAAESGIVLMKNANNALPLAPGTLNVFGEGLHMFRECGVGAGKTLSRYSIGFKRAIRESADFALNEELARWHQENGDALPPAGLLSDAREKSDTALVVLTRFGGENTDSSTAPGDYHLSNEEDALLKGVSEHFAHVVVILNTPGPIDTSFVERYGIDALLYVGFAGMLGGQALLNILSGKTNPSGKLVDSWPQNYHDIPASRNFYDCAKDGPRLGADDGVWLDTVYEEGLYVGYRFHTTFDVPAAYPFGHGLSYTTFSIRARERDFSPESGLNVTVKVTNTGSVPGKQVAQLYISKPERKGMEQPSRELVAFEKTRLLAPGESETLELTAPVLQLTSYSEEKAAYLLPAGEYTVSCGASSVEVAFAGRFSLERDVIVKQVKPRMRPITPVSELSHWDAQASWPCGNRSGIKDVSGVEPARDVPPISRMGSIPQAVASMPPEELCRMVVCSAASWNMTVNGVAGRLAVPEGSSIPGFTVADGNSGVRVDPRDTGFPATAVLAASFDKVLLRQIGVVLGEEARERGVSLLLAPGMNLHRNPLNGRNVEYFSEDPVLTGVLAAAYCEGLESTGVGGCYKHLLCNNAESSRKRNQSILSERTLRELYLRPFELALSIYKPVSIMTSYNAVNGCHTAADIELLEGILREENGFDGFIMTDWNSYDSCDRVAMLLAGMNWLTPGSEDDSQVQPLKEAVSQGRLPLESLQSAVLYLARAAERMAAMGNGG